MMFLVTREGAKTNISGLPECIGLLDVALAPDFATSKQVYFSYMARDLSAPRVGRAKDDPSAFPERMIVARATLVESASAASLSGVQVIFKQEPAVTTFPGSGEPGGRIAFSPDRQHVFITSGDRQELDTTLLQNLGNNIGTVARIFPDGSIPPDNPFVNTPGARPEIWTWGHRNSYGLAFGPDGRLWSSEMGPFGGDELNVLVAGRNYGWPLVSNGDNYDRTSIPDHKSGDGFEAPKVSWTPVIAPAGMLFYKGGEFADWRGSVLLTGLQSKGLVRVSIGQDGAQEAQRLDLGTRIRDIAEAPDGSLWILTDGSLGELRRITPVF